MLWLLRKSYAANIYQKERLGSENGEGSLLDEPGLASRFHLICERDVVGPDVELPLPESQHPAVHPAAVDADSHVHVHPGHLPHQPAEETNKQESDNLHS